MTGGAVRPRRSNRPNSRALWIEWLELVQHGRDQFRDGGVDMHGALQRLVVRLRVHGIEDPVNRLVAFGPEDRGAENVLRFGVDDDLHEAQRLTLLDGAPDLGHGAGPNQEPPAGGSRLGLAQPDA